MIVRPLSQARKYIPRGSGVLISGAFDPLHYGHIRYIEQAAGYSGGYNRPLVVAVAPDSYIARRHPLLQPLADRMEMVAALAHVDFVVPQEEETLVKAIREIAPRFLVKGEDWREKGLPQVELEAVEEVGTQLVWVPVNPVSSSDLLRSAFWRFADEWAGRM